MAIKPPPWLSQKSLYEDESSGFMRTNPNFNVTTNGFLGVNDGLTQLRKEPHNAFFRELAEYERAENGNVVQVGELARPAIEKEYCCQPYTLALGFGKTPDEALNAAQDSLKKGFETCEAEYKTGWRNYLKTIRRVGIKYQAQFNMAAMILKAHEDKTFRGANVASLSVPWGGGDNANEPNVGGYHTVWARDLYQVATAFDAMGDKAAAEARAQLSLHRAAKVGRQLSAKFLARRATSRRRLADGRGRLSSHPRLSTGTHGQRDVGQARQARCGFY